MCVVFHHQYWPKKEVYCCKQCATVIKERDPNQYFDLLLPNKDEDETNPNENCNGQEIDPTVFQCSGSSAGDMAHVWSLGLGVDDDNQHALEIFQTTN